MEYVLLLVPVIFIVVSIVLAIKAVNRGVKQKHAFLFQLASFVLVGFLCFALPMAANAASAEAEKTETASEAQPASFTDSSMGFIAAALSTGLAGIGGGLAVAAAAPAAIGATAEDPKSFGKSLIFVALGEGIALYGLLVSILIYSKI